MLLNVDFIWMLVSFILTIFVFSYLFGDNILFRFVSAIFIGVAAGYLAVIICYQVLLPRLIVPILQGSLTSLIPLILSGLLCLKLSPKLSRLGNVSMAYLVGAGAAVAIGGAVLGTLFTQIRSVFTSFDVSATTGVANPFFGILEAVFLLIGTVATLAYFHFGTKSSKDQSAKRGVVASIFAWIGRIFIAITLGSVFAGVLTAAITALIERTDFIVQIVKIFLK